MSVRARLDAMAPRERRAWLSLLASELVGVGAFLATMAALVLLASVARS